MKKKKFKFDVVFELRELTNVSLASGLLFSKLRLLDGGKFTETCYRVDVSNNRVKWQQTFNFSCKMTANTNTGVLDPCFCRISVRKETKGGKSYEKLGFVDINMAEFAGQNKRTRKYLLEGHDEKLNRQDNSILEVRISMILRQGDPLFKLPTVQNPHSTLELPSSKGEPSCGQEDGRGLPSNNPDEHGAGAVTSGSGTPSSQSSHASTSLDGDDQTITKLALAEGSNIVTGKALGHHRSASEPPLTKDVLQTGQLSEGYGSMTTQSTSSSSDAGRRFNSIERTPSKYQRSRVDPGNVVEQIINSQEDESSRSNNHDQNNVATFGFAQDGMSGLMISDFGLESEDKYRTL